MLHLKDMNGIPHWNTPRVDNYSLGNCFKMGSVQVSNMKILDNGYAPTVVERYFHYDEETKSLVLMMSLFMDSFKLKVF